MIALSSIKNIAIGSKNPVKLNAVRLAFEKLEITEIEIISVDEPDMRGVSHQPLTREETLQGAINRGNYCHTLYPEAEMFCGVEGGVFFDEKKEKCYLFGVVYIKDKNGYENFSYTGDALLPDSVAQRLLNGEELGPVMNEILHTDDISRTTGTFGALTRSIINRTDSFMYNTIQTLIPWINQEKGWY